MQRIILPALAALAMALLFTAPVQGAETPAPTLKGTLALGGANIGVRFAGESAETAFGIEGKLKIENALGPAGLRFECRHFVSNHPFWKGKSRLKAGLDVPLARDTLFFATFERAYRRDIDWVFAGLQFAFESR